MLASEPINFSYSTPEDTVMRRSIIRACEAIGGQRKLKGLYEDFLDGETSSKDFFNAAMELLALDVKLNDDSLQQVPSNGPVVFIANHPYGVLDGIALTWLARRARPDVKVMANSVLCQAPDAAGSLLPVDFSGTRQALQTNIDTRATAMKTLEEGGAVGIFPAGGVAVSEKPHKGPAVDTAWHPFAAKMIKRTGASVMPIYFGGQNSRLFQMASHMSYTLRLALFFYETARRIGSEFEIAIGDLITSEEISKFKDKTELNTYLRKQTYSLASRTRETKVGYPRYDREFIFPKRMSL